MHHGDGVDISFFEFDCSKVRGQAKVSKVVMQCNLLSSTVSLITFGSQVIWQYKMDLFPVAVLGSRNYFVWQNCGGVRVQVLEFLQTLNCFQSPEF